jgi:hypothetical protein
MEYALDLIRESLLDYIDNSNNKMIVRSEIENFIK